MGDSRDNGRPPSKRRRIIEEAEQQQQHQYQYQYQYQQQQRSRLQRQQRPEDEIVNADQLQRLLCFKQDVGPGVKAAVNQFKDFLTTISRDEDGNLALQSRRLQALRQYCHDQKETGSTTQPPSSFSSTTNNNSQNNLDFSDLISTWSFAVQANNDSICSAVPAAMAQFYKTISALIEFRDFGVSLGRTLLRRDQVRLLDHGLSAAKTKTHLISPCLRLLTELISFDGGVLASAVFDRSVLFRRFDFFLDPHSVEYGSGTGGSAVDGSRRRPTVRRMALRLLMVCLKFLDVAARIELVTRAGVMWNCIDGLMFDGDDVVVEVLRCIETEVIEDKNVIRSAKISAFNGRILQRLARLYEYEPDPDHPDSEMKVRSAAHDLLLKICTTRKGVLLPQTGWYPGTLHAKIDPRPDENYIDLELNSPANTDQHDGKVPLKNNELASFVASLKPENDMLQSTLVLRTLRAAPEMVADYLSKKPGLLPPSSDDDAAWRNQFAFYFSLAQLPVPLNFGWSDGAPTDPPPISIAIESIIPRPFGRVTLSKYLTSNEEILVLSAARLLLVALEKLQTVTEMFAARKGSDKWQQALTRLVEVAAKRAPKVQEMVNALQRAGNDNNLLKTTLYKCVAAFYRTLPEATSGSKFDISSTLVDLLSRIESNGVKSEPQTNEDSESLMEQIATVLDIAELSNATRWWVKSDSESMSLFGRLLRFSVTAASGQIRSRVSAVLESVAVSAGFLGQGNLSFAALQSSVVSTGTFRPMDEAWVMLDNALSHAVTKPVKYLDQIETIQHTVSDTNPISLLAATVREQWEFVLKKHAARKDVIMNIAEWTARLFSALDSIGENFRVLKQLQDDMTQTSEGICKDVLEKAFDRVRMNPVSVVRPQSTTASNSEITQTHTTTREVNLSGTLGLPEVGPISLTGSERWDHATDIEVAVQSGRVAHLLYCTASPEEEIRRQAFVHLQNLLHLVDRSEYDEKTQMYLLVGEVVETVRQHGLNAPLPSAAAELAARLLRIVADPGDKMYGKANTFLLRSPAWSLKHLIPYWIRDVLLREPDSDDAGSWTVEVEWLIEWLVAGLRTNTDMETYRRSGVLEKVLVIYTKPGLARSIRRRILTLVWRGVCIGGVDTLITRVGIESWLRIAAVVDRDHDNIINELAQAIAERCDTASIQRWQQDRPVLREVK